MILINLQNLRIAEKNMLPALHEVLYSDHLQDAVEHITETHNIDGFELSAHIGYVLLALLPVAQLAHELQESCNISQEQALAVVVDVRRYVFAPVARDLASIQEIAKKNYNTYNTT